MKKPYSEPYIIKSISELHHLFALPQPDHPLISVIDFELLSYQHSDIWKHFTNDFYCIVLKKGSNGNLKYGLKDYDFAGGLMTFTKPGQVFSVTSIKDNPVEGYMLVFKAELIRSYPLGKKIDEYGFFSYSIAEALHLSEKENMAISSLLRQLQEELKNNIDYYSQDVIVSHVDLLLHYSNRFYNRQFITRKAVNNDILARLEQIVKDYFNHEKTLTQGLPTVQYLASELHLSPDYLTDLLRKTIGQGTQQYIHEHLIEKAKELLSASGFTVGEIAYQLGFEYPQSFSKLFKKNTKQTPLEFRKSFN
ncbi:helix-turn-helix domain-containing protein [Chryseobacterium sp. T20]|uniref:helix-turn-helix domain-containing protein n=1 Tax=Chryseobacterium sp. T20 TaxID=3395375 RepID=UPI0039BD5072